MDRIEATFGEMAVAFLAAYVVYRLRDLLAVGLPVGILICLAGIAGIEVLRRRRRQPNAPQIQPSPTAGGSASQARGYMDFLKAKAASTATTCRGRPNGHHLIRDGVCTLCNEPEETALGGRGPDPT
jgi:hypothetical protein